MSGAAVFVIDFLDSKSFSITGLTNIEATAALIKISSIEDLIVRANIRNDFNILNNLASNH